MATRRKHADPPQRVARGGGGPGVSDESIVVIPLYVSLWAIFKDCRVTRPGLRSDAGERLPIVVHTLLRGECCVLSHEDSKDRGREHDGDMFCLI